MPKKTRLGDDAAIYQQRPEQTEKEKLKDMPWKKRISYLWDYYKYHALFTIIGIAVIIYTIYLFVRPRVETKLYAAIINNPIETAVWDEYKEKMFDYLEIDPKTEDIIINYNFYFNSTADYEAGMREVFAVHTATSQIDIVIAPLSEFETYVKTGFFNPLSDQLPTDLYSLLTDKFYVSDTEDNPKVAAYGIYLTDTKLFKEHAITTTEDNPYLIGIVANSNNRENAVEFIRYIFSEK